MIPVRRREAHWEVCLITSIRKQRWILPKGIVEDGETLVEAGLKEAWEEAGLRGEIDGPVLGEYADRKWNCDLRVHVMLMRVASVAEDWPEAELRQRCWKTPFEARAMLHQPALREIVSMATF